MLSLCVYGYMSNKNKFHDQTQALTPKYIVGDMHLFQILKEKNSQIKNIFGPNRFA